MIYDIKASLNGQTVRRVAYGDLQAWLIVNQLSRDGYKNICMGERGTSGGGEHGKIWVYRQKENSAPGVCSWLSGGIRQAVQLCEIRGCRVAGIARVKNNRTARRGLATDHAQKKHRGRRTPNAYTRTLQRQNLRRNLLTAAGIVCYVMGVYFRHRERFPIIRSWCPSPTFQNIIFEISNQI